VTASLLLLTLIHDAWLRRVLIRPLTRLAKGAKKLAAADFSHCIEVRGEDEIAGLGRSFNAMAESLERTAVSCDRLRESEARFRLMTDSSPMLVWLSDAEGGITYFNRSWLDFTGRRLDQELGWGWTERAHPDDREDCLDAYARALEARRSFSLEYRLRHHSGGYRWVLNVGVPRFTDKGELSGYIASGIDIDRRKHREHRLQQAKQGTEAVTRAERGLLAAMSTRSELRLT